MKPVLKPCHFKLLSLALIVLSGIIVYSNTFLCSFHLDDATSISHNPAVTDIHQWKRIWDFLPRHFILNLSFALNYHFHQLKVPGYHVFNLAVHLSSAILVWWLTLLTLSTPVMKGDKITPYGNFIALFAGLIFVSHPVQTEAVTYIVQRAASMSAFFYLASLSLYVKSRLMENNGSIPGTGKFYYICSLLTAMMAMFTKETAITLPLMIVLYEISFFGMKEDFKWGRLVPFLLTLFIIPVTMLLTETSAARLQQLRSEPGISSSHYLLTQFRVMVTYIRLLFFPLNQNLDYDYPIFRNFFEWPVLISFIFLTAIFCLAIRHYSKYRLVSFSIFWFFLTLLPESSLLPIKDVIFEHRLYLPMAGYSIFLAGGAYYILGKNDLKWMCIALICIIFYYGILTYQRNEIWKDDVTLWNDAVIKSPHKARPYNYRGVAYIEKNELTQAIADFTQVIALDPTLLEAYNNRAGIYAKQGKFTQAILDYNKAIELDPDMAAPYFNLAHVYIKQGRFIQAIPLLTQVINKKPKLAAAFYERGMLYYQIKEYGRSWADIRQAGSLGARIDPRFINALKRASGGI